MLGFNRMTKALIDVFFIRCDLIYIEFEMTRQHSTTFIHIEFQTIQLVSFCTDLHRQKGWSSTIGTMYL